jgi:hypothetical protein
MEQQLIIQLQLEEEVIIFLIQPNMDIKIRKNQYQIMDKI